MKQPVCWGIDVSYDNITPEKAQALKDAGVQVVMQCLWTGAEQPSNRVTNLRNLSYVGMTLGGYISVSAGRSGADHAKMGRQGVPDDLWDLLRRVPVDHELTGYGFDTITDCAIALINMGKPPDIYTNYDSWVNKLGNPHRPEGWGLWNAFWDNDPDSDFERYPFGGWQPNEVWGEQFTGGENVAGVNADRDVFSKEAFGLLVVPPPDPQPPEKRVIILQEGDKQSVFLEQ